MQSGINIHIYTNLYIEKYASKYKHCRKGNTNVNSVAPLTWIFDITGIRTLSPHYNVIKNIYRITQILPALITDSCSRTVVHIARKQIISSQ